MADKENTKSTRLFVSEHLQELVNSGQLTPPDQEYGTEPTADSPERLKQAVKELSPDQRELLVQFQMLSCKQIAERRQQSVSSIQRALSDLYRNLRTKIEFT